MPRQAGPQARVLAGHEDDPFDSLVALRLLGGVHRRVLLGLEPRLAAHYPSTGGDDDAASAVTVVLGVFEEHADELRRRSNARPRRTRWDGPVRSSARSGTSSRSRRCRCGSSRWARAEGSTSSPIAFASKVPANRAGGVARRVRGRVARQRPVDRPPPGRRRAARLRPRPDRLVDRGGRADVDLVRLARPAGAARAAPRRARARACESGHGREAERGGLRRRPRPRAGRVDGAVALGHVAVPRRRGACCGPRPPRSRGASAADDAPLAHLAFEPRRLAPDADLAFYVTVRTWPGGPERTLGVAPAHGLPVEWA